MERFRDRRHAGMLLGRALSSYAGRPDVVVLGLPRGGIPVAYEIAIRLDAPLDALVVRKIGVPGYEELAMGAIASGGIQVLDQRTIQQLGVSLTAVRAAVAKERTELERRERVFRGDRPPLDIAGKIAILVDDGLATGSTMIAAVAALRVLHPAKVVVAIPIASAELCHTLRAHVDEVTCMMTPEHLHSAGRWYDDFAQPPDAEVRDLLGRARARESGTGVSTAHA